MTEIGRKLDPPKACEFEPSVDGENPMERTLGRVTKNGLEARYGPESTKRRLINTDGDNECGKLASFEFDDWISTLDVRTLDTINDSLPDIT
jgi:hypothetical protein